MLADHHLHRRLELLEDLRAELELRRPPELRQVAAEEHEVGLRVERVDVVDRLDDRAHEALVERALVQVRVRDVGEAEGQRPGALRCPILCQSRRSRR